MTRTRYALSGWPLYGSKTIWPANPPGAAAAVVIAIDCKFNPFVESWVDAMYPHGYSGVVIYTVEQTATFVAWHVSLRDLRAKVAIARRLDRIAAGLLGDTKPVGGDVSEARVDVGKGYRLSFTVRRRVVVVLLCGGDKRTQRVDIARARALAKEV